MGEIEYVDEPLDFSARRDTVIIEWPTGVKQAIPIDVFRENYRRAGKVLDVWAEAHSNNVVGIRRGRPKK